MTNRRSTPRNNAASGRRRVGQRLADLSLSRKIGGFAGCALVGVAVVVLAASSGLASMASKGDLLKHDSAVGKVLLEGDMAHDAIRADVLTSIQFSGTATGAAARTDLVDHAGILTSAIDEAGKASLGAKVDSAIKVVRPDVKAYTSAAASLVKLAATSPDQAQAQYGKFLAKFK